MNTRKVLQLKNRKESQILKDKLRLAKHQAEFDVIIDQLAIDRLPDDYINDEMLELNYAE